MIACPDLLLKCSSDPLHLKCNASEAINQRQWGLNTYHLAAPVRDYAPINKGRKAVGPQPLPFACSCP
eukprot:1143778-Pelagomonas_calceolata.AAC.5